MLGDLAQIYARVYAAAVIKPPGLPPAEVARDACRDFIAFLEESKTK